ncbi:hypothetical protein E3C22_24130 [Jiella endophytica]|uniref:Uncharacterized protein n=1 Tax=Jiella endophytica TaxID=2558362 RepID=A0A4Y8R887_9HYPH|nr:hypothetical protein [Jiella endophytica]TFF17223.1 hypothetical protein E3C22_24130 [Jiella endophytica]
MTEDVPYEFTGIIDAIDPKGFQIIAERACAYLTYKYECDDSYPDKEILRDGYNRWVKGSIRLPLNIYNTNKRNLVVVATLVEFMSSCNFASYVPKNDNGHYLIKYSSELTALVMGILLYDILLRTAYGSGTVVRYIDIDKISEYELEEAIFAIKERKSYKYKFRKLLSILEKFSEPEQYH